MDRAVVAVTVCIAKASVIACATSSDTFLSNVPDHLLPIAFGTRACFAGDVPKVPKARELCDSVRSALFLFHVKRYAVALRVLKFSNKSILSCVGLGVNQLSARSDCFV